MFDLTSARLSFAEEIRSKAALRSDALAAAFAKVPREQYLGAGPWRIKRDDHSVIDRIINRLRGEYGTTTDPRDLYRDVHVAIDPARGLNNGRPSRIAQWLDLLELQSGERVAHIGCGLGYYTAVIAEVVGTRGEVIGIEIDRGLAAAARKNLAHFRQVEVLHADGNEYQPAPCSAILVNAGADRLRSVWIDSLQVGGRLIVPLTVDDGRGVLLRVRRNQDDYEARIVSSARIFHCAGSHDPASTSLLREALRRDYSGLKSIRTAPHSIDESCWLHEDGKCLSKVPISGGN